MKTFGTLFMSGLIALCFAVSSNAQSSGKGLDQAKLLKQLSGKWKSDIGKDSTVIWEATPFGEGFVTKGEYKAKGETDASYRQLVGISPDNKKVILYSMWENGRMTWYIGKFVSERKLIFEELDIAKLGVIIAGFLSAERIRAHDPRAERPFWPQSKSEGEDDEIQPQG
jgi:hypothetical protein